MEPSTDIPKQPLPPDLPYTAAELPQSVEELSNLYLPPVQRKWGYTWRNTGRLAVFPKLPLQVLTAAALCGIALAFLCNGQPGLGINIFLAVLVAAAVWGVIATNTRPPLWRRLAVGAAVLFGALVATRSSAAMGALATLVAVFLMLLGCTSIWKSHIVSFRRVAHNWAQMLQNLLSGPLLLLTKEIKWGKSLGDKGWGQVKGVLRGLIFGAPIVFVFALLLMEADQAFSGVMESLRSSIAMLLSEGVFRVLAWTWVFAAVFRNSFISIDLPPMRVGGYRKFGYTEAVTMMVLLAALFGLFILSQLQYLFGGMSKVLSTPDLTMADYARRGFFELTVVAGAMLPLLMALEWVTRRINPAQKRVFRGLGILLTGFVGMMLFSAFHRMYLYTTTFGLTELRLYVTAFIIFLAAVFVEFDILVLRGRRANFFAVVVATGALAAGLLVLSNPHGIIAGYNIGRHLAGSKSDINYIGTLSIDAIPAIKRSALPAEDKNRITHGIWDRHQAKKVSWRGWALSEVFAHPGR